MQSLHSSEIGLIVEASVVLTFSERFGLKVILMKKEYNSTGSTVETVYYVDENFVRVENLSGSYDFTYVRHEGQLVAQLNPDGTKLFMHGDHLGSTSTITNSSGSVIESTTYAPTGEILSGGAVSRYDYTGKEYSSVVGDYDYNFRKMNPSWDIFTQPDSLLPNVYDPQQLNRYSYARDNPYRFKDETGHCIWDACIVEVAAGIGALVGLGTYFLTHDDYTLKGALSYTAGGAVSAAAGVYGIGAAIVGGVSAQFITNNADEKELTDGIGNAALISGLTAGLGKEFLPASKDWLIKHTLSFFTTKTGQQFIKNTFVEESVGNLVNNFISNSLSQSSPKVTGGSSYPGFGGTRKLSETEKKFVDTREKLRSSGKSTSIGNILKQGGLKK